MSEEEEKTIKRINTLRREKDKLSWKIYYIDLELEMLLNKVAKM